MNNYSLAVFDIAGTTVKDRGNVASSFINAFRENGHPIPADEVNKVMGWRKADAIKMLLMQYYGSNDSLTTELVNQIHDDFIHNMILFYEQDEELQPLYFAEEVFEDLRRNNIKIALNTGFTRSIADVILKRLEWLPGGKIDYIVASDEVDEGRPYPFMIQHLMKEAGITEPSSVVKIGDTEVDIMEGRNAGCGMVVGVTTGAYTKEELKSYKPDFIIDRLSQLPSLIL
ncbi:MAG: HAD-IA family hydrolase [Lacibacter sp.]